MSVKGVIFSCEGFKLKKKEKLFFSKTNPFGFVLFKRNFKNKLQVTNLIKEIKEITLNKKLLVFIDQEGGKVQRFDNEEFNKIPAQSFFGNIYNKNRPMAKKLAYYNAYVIGQQLKDVGIDVNFSPVLDIRFSYGNKVIGNRSFGKNVEMISILGKQYCRGFRDSGIFPVLKHFPGHGRSKKDSHLELPRLKVSFKNLVQSDIKSFRYLKDEIFVMLAHIVYENVDKNIATYSQKLINELLIKKMKFNGLIITDDLSMKALKGSIEERTIKSYDAGCDIVLYCDAKLNEMKTIYENSRFINTKKLEYLKEYKKNLCTSKCTNSTKMNEILYSKK